MTKLSVNINKIATLRNARGEDYPNLVKSALDIIGFGAQGITVHPRPDERHIKYSDAYMLKEKINSELNIEGNPNINFVNLVNEIKPAQVTLVPDSEDVNKDDITFSDALNIYLKLKGNDKPVTFKSSAERASRYLIEVSGNKSLTCYKRGDATSLRDNLFKRGLAGSSVVRIFIL